MSLSPLEQVPGPYEDTTCQMVVAYGDPDHDHLNTIRWFRDAVLAEYALGRRFIDAYYRTAPVAAGIVRKHAVFRPITRYFIAYPAYIVSRVFRAFKGR